MTTAQLLQQLSGVTGSGPAWKALCPAHGDRNPSLNIREGEDGKTLLWCGAGCTTEAVLQALGLRWADLFPGDPATGPGRITAVYDYTDEGGTLLYQKVRYESKDFRCRRPDGQGGWIWRDALNGVRRVIYRLPELRAALAEKSRPVFVVEGEKDCDALWARGLLATTNLDGAAKAGKPKWRDEYTEQLLRAGGKQIVVIPDADAAGVAHAKAVAESCAKAKLTVKLVPLLSGLKRPGGDVSDFFLSARRSVADLIQHVQATRCWILGQKSRYVWEDRSGSQDGASQAQELLTGPVLVTLADVSAEPITWLWPGRIPRGKLTLLAGEPGTGKSNVVLDLIARVTTGNAWPDGGRASQGAALLLTGEDDLRDTVRPRLDAMGGNAALVKVLTAVRKKARKKDGEDLVEDLFSLEDDLLELETAIGQTEGATLVGIDPVSAYWGGKADSFKDTEVRRVLAPLAGLAGRTGVAVVGVTHLNKKPDLKAIHRVIGSIGFVGQARAVFAVAKDQADPGRRLFVPVKTNLTREPSGLAFRLEEVQFPGGIKTSRVAWETGTIQVDADAALAGPASAEDRHTQTEAADFLRTVLREGPVPVAEVEEQARRAGLKMSDVKLAKGPLGVKSDRRGFGEHGHWVWYVPASKNTPP